MTTELTAALETIQRELIARGLMAAPVAPTAAPQLPKKEVAPTLAGTPWPYAAATPVAPETAPKPTDKVIDPYKGIDLSRIDRDDIADELYDGIAALKGGIPFAQEQASVAQEQQVVRDLDQTIPVKDGVPQLALVPGATFAFGNIEGVTLAKFEPEPAQPPVAETLVQVLQNMEKRMDHSPQADPALAGVPVPAADFPGVVGDPVPDDVSGISGAIVDSEPKAAAAADVPVVVAQPGIGKAEALPGLDPEPEFAYAEAKRFAMFAIDYVADSAKIVGDKAAHDYLVDHNIGTPAACSVYLSQIKALGTSTLQGIANLTKTLTATVLATMESEALASNNQDFFAAAARSRWNTKRDDGRKLFKALKERLTKQGRWTHATQSKFAAQAESIADAKVEKKTENADKGVGQKQLGMDSAVNAHGSYVQIARRIAVELAKHGPITIDDVTTAMARDHKVATGEAGEGRSHTWKGSVFASSEWIAVGHMASRIPEAHARPVIQWALKEWLEKNTLNGRGGDVVSAFNLERIFKDFKRVHPGMDMKTCNWYIGEEKLAADIRQSIVMAGLKLYEVPVSLMAGSVGATLLPPNYAQRIVTPATAAKVVQP